jgi:hypothetical protein
MYHDGFAKPVAPNPGMPKTIGILNIVFGGLLLLCGMGCVTPYLSSLSRSNGFEIDPQVLQRGLDKLRQDEIAELKKKEAAATNDAEKERLAEQRRKVEAKHTRIEDQLDFNKVNTSLRWVPRYLWAELLTGPLLNILMLISGIGLVLIKEWGRVLGIVIALLKIVRLIALAVLLSLFVIPALTSVGNDLIRTEAGKDFMAKAMEEQQARQGRPAGPAPNFEELIPMVSIAGTIYAIVFTCLGAIYPVIALVILTRPGTRAACALSEDSGPEFETRPTPFP